MKAISHFSLLLFFAVFSFNCQKELSRSTTLTDPANNQSLPLTASVQGNVLDENGQPAEGAVISVGSKMATTNSHGYFRVSSASLDANASLVTAELPGYFKAYRSFRATRGVNQLVFKLVPKKLAGRINSTSGGEAKLANGSKV